MCIVVMHLFKMASIMELRLATYGISCMVDVLLVGVFQAGNPFGRPIPHLDTPFAFVLGATLVPALVRDVWLIRTPLLLSHTRMFLQGLGGFHALDKSAQLALRVENLEQGFLSVANLLSMRHSQSENTHEEPSKKGR